ncbi:DUF443 domain-containing protein [Salipaludibacillus sp. LMS25]|jgi:uncharacterized membrane protein (TIGR01218 family)|uniref:DUF443 family protein n=1 Tax=Salipaludibacillus sp. LMS25 TaxID=2924031 RepID=UPI0020D10762|nr:DUF443 family protein [Salipaludibacillus sp. LMS25]UTR13820.1 DUF443 domain-containing protein [Salipaludibacillus sp. LMS25]
MVNGDLQFIYNNIRYRLVYIDGNYYVIDIMSPLWKVLFPFVFWIFPHKGYRINDEKIVELLRDPTIPQKRTMLYNFGAIGIALAIARILGEIDDYFHLATSSVTNTVILVCSLIVFFLFACRISHIHKENLIKKVAISQLQTDQLVIRPLSLKQYLLFFVYYMFLLIVSVLTCWLFIYSGNMLILLGAVLFVFSLSISVAVAARVGETYGKLATPK